MCLHFTFSDVSAKPIPGLKPHVQLKGYKYETHLKSLILHQIDPLKTARKYLLLEIYLN